MEKCIFCRLIAGELPAKKEYEDEEVVVIHDINPAAPIHVLLIPKRHFEAINQTVSKEILGKMLKIAVEMATKLGVGESYRLIINRGKWVQEVPHFHLHLIGGWKTPEEIPGGAVLR